MADPIKHLKKEKKKKKLKYLPSENVIVKKNQVYFIVKKKIQNSI